MKYNKLVLGAVLLAATTLSTSCSKSYLDTKPYTSIEAGQALKSEADLLVALRGTYAGMRNSNLYGRTIPLLGDLFADVTYISSQNSNRYIDEQRYTITVTNGNASATWAAAYTVILRANNIINSAVTANTNVNQYKGEAYAARALMYFELVRLFAKPYTDDPNALGVPLSLQYNPSALPLRSTVAQVYTQIESDLAQAFNLMTTFSSSGQFSKYAAKALLAKVYLTKGEYANAKAAAVDVITNSGFTVATAAQHAGYWASATQRTDKLETLFEVVSDATNNAGTDALAYIYNQAGYGDMLAADDFYASFSATDVRRNLMTAGTRGGGPCFFVTKYNNVTNANDKDDTKVLRLSDVYLIAAEASARTADEVSARTYVNYVATRRDAAFTGYVSTGAQLVDDILNERKKELAFEGDRFHTLNRLKMTINRGANYPAAARTIAYPFNFRLYPIPQDEIQANPGLAAQQNAGY